MNLYGRPANNIFSSSNSNNNTNRSTYLPNTTNNQQQNLPWNNSTSTNIFSNNNNNINRSSNNNLITNATNPINNLSNNNNNSKLGTYRATNYVFEKPPAHKLHKQWTQSNYPASISSHQAFQNMTSLQMRIEDYYLIRTGSLESSHKNLLHDAIQKKRFNQNINNSRSMVMPITATTQSSNNYGNNNWMGNNSNNMTGNNTNSGNNLRNSMIGQNGSNNNTNAYNNSSTSNNIFSRGNTNNNIFGNNNSNTNNGGNNNISNNSLNNLTNNNNNNNNLFNSRTTRSQTGNNNTNNIFSTNTNSNNIFTNPNTSQNNNNYYNTSNNNNNNNNRDTNMFSSIGGQNNNIFSQNQHSQSNTNNLFSNSNSNNQSSNQNNNLFSQNNNQYSNNSSNNIFSNPNNIFSNQNLFNTQMNDNNSIYKNNNNNNMFNSNTFQTPQNQIYPYTNIIPQNNMFPTFYPVPQKIYNQLIKASTNTIQNSMYNHNQRQSGLQRQIRIQKALKIRHDSPFYYEQRRRRKSPDCIKIHIIQNNNKGSKGRPQSINIFDDEQQYRPITNRNNLYYQPSKRQQDNEKQINIYIKVIIKCDEGKQVIQQFNERRKKIIDKDQLAEQIVSKLIRQNVITYQHPLIQIKNHNLYTVPYTINLEIDDRLVKIPNGYFYMQSAINNTKITDLIIGNQWGKIKWEGVTDIQGINFSSVIKINQNNLQFYEGCKKPQKGQGLNKQCTVVFNTCILATKMRQKDGKLDRQKLIKRLKKGCEDQRSEFLAYDQVTDVWSLRIKNFQDDE